MYMYTEGTHHCSAQINPSSPNSDQHQISPCTISALREVIRTGDMITQEEFFLTFY